MNIKCPKCHSDNVNVYILVHGMAWGNIKSGSVDGGPDYCDFDTDDVENADEFQCDVCFYKWKNV